MGKRKNVIMTAKKIASRIRMIFQYIFLQYSNNFSFSIFNTILVLQLYAIFLKHSFTGKKLTDTSHADYYFAILFIM